MGINRMLDVAGREYRCSIDSEKRGEHSHALYFRENALSIFHSAQLAQIALRDGKLAQCEKLINKFEEMENNV